jgi:Spy/CpxP family protein refolding chaperone
MKSIVKIGLATAAISLIGILSVNAQRGSGRGSGYGPGHGYGFGPDSCHVQLMVDDLAKELDLSEDQEAKILQLHYDHMAEVKAFRTEYKNDCVGARDARLASREKLDNSIIKLLDDEQKGKYKEFMDDRRGPHGRPHRHWHK